METLYTSKLYTNQIFKNYKELCAYLNEEPKKANSKKAQIKEWERYFSFIKEGQKIIITEVFDDPLNKIDNRGGNNNKNVKPVMDYLMSVFNTSKIDKYYTISNWSTAILHILNKEVCDVTYRDDEELIKFCEIHNISDIKLFREYVGTVKFVTKNLITTAFRGLQKRGFLKYEEGYKFRYQCDGHTNTVSTNELNDYIDKMEREICDTLYEEFFDGKKIKGKQLVYILQHGDNKKELQLYNEMRIQQLNDDDDVVSLLNDAICDRDDAIGYSSGDFIDGTEKYRLLNYYKAFMITEFNGGCNTGSKDEVIEVIKKLALRNISYNSSHLLYDEEFRNSEIENINDIIFGRYSSCQKENEISDDGDDELDCMFGYAS